jgi:methionyl-tRNA formyltransferase
MQQDHAQATMAPILKKEDGLIDWTMPAVDIENRVRGLSPWPGAYTDWGGERWTLWRVSAQSHDSGLSPGTISVVTKDALEVATGKGTIRLLEIQPANSRRMTMAQYLAGHRLTPGTILGASPNSIA